ncbi:MAG: cell division inhibitor SepF [Acidimicrobiia bacterium]|nr:cell division inhibitor SepF [Acidimicrobiia bacterium]
MGSMWRNAMRYLGLAPDDEFDEYDEEPERPNGQHNRAPAPVQPVGRQPIQAVPQPRSAAARGALHDDTRTEAMASVRPLPVTNNDPTPPIQREVVRPRPSPTYARPNVVLPRSFTDAQEVADRFKANQPVIMNLQGLDRDLARRLIDFASGLCYGLGGQMDKVAKEVFLLTPADVQVPEELRRYTGRAEGT